MTLLRPVTGRLFLYGTLRDPAFLAKFIGRPIALAPARLRGWRRVAMRDRRYPTLRRGRCYLDGVVAWVDRSALARLAAYGGSAYRLAPVMVETEFGKVAAWVWIAAGGLRRDWP
jgi:gamma-glutamylcyclotransferase (GGCT)/AIG2-like uncharacterized protein YtfP